MSDFTPDISPAEQPQPLHNLLIDNDPTNDAYFYDEDNLAHINEIWGASFDDKANTVEGQCSASTTFEVAIEDALFFISRGKLSGGMLTVGSSPDQVKGFATVEIIMYYMSKEIRDLVKVCVSTQGIDTRGVAVLTPTWKEGHLPPDGEDCELSFATVITLPQGPYDSPFIVNTFETDTANTFQFVEDLSNVFFNKISLVGANGRIASLCLNAGDLNIRTSNAPIRGSFSTNNTMSLTNSNDVINVYVKLLPGVDSARPVCCVAKTSDSEIVIHATVNPSKPDTSPGIFSLDAQTSNGPLAIAFHRAPISSELRVQASTENAPAIVTMPPTFEGTFMIEASPPNVDTSPAVEDPEEKARKRTVDSQINEDQTMIAGEVTWSEESRGTGDVFISTTNSPATLAFPATTNTKFYKSVGIPDL